MYGVLVHRQGLTGDGPDGPPALGGPKKGGPGTQSERREAWSTTAVM